MDARVEDQAAGSPSGRSLRALVVEADPDYAVSVKAIAEAASLVVTVAHSASMPSSALCATVTTSDAASAIALTDTA